MSNLPYYPISKYYQHRFGEKVYKIPVSVAEDCPNRRGLKGMKTCIFCDEWGSAAKKDSHTQDLRTQIETTRTHIRSKYGANKFLVYYQAYTNTFLGLKPQRESYDIALEYPDVVGLVVGTRPDCLSPSVYQLWNEYNEKTAVFVELGVQSFFNDQLEFMRRGHSAEDSISAIYKIREKTAVNLGIHLMFGQPGETDEQVVETAKICSKLPIHNVKLHNLHVLTNTPLAEMYHRGEFTPISLEDYMRRVALFLEHLSPAIAVHRLGAVASRWDELVAPEWVRYKMVVFQNTVDYMNARRTYQGRLYDSAQESALASRNLTSHMLGS